MAKQNTTPKQSSGGGYIVENEAVAWVLTYLLARSSPFDPPGGVVERIDTQRPATEWHLDDLLVTVRSRGHQHRLAFSIKSNRQITREGFPADFICEAWEQLLHDSSGVFAENRDYLGLLTAPLDAGLKTAVFELLRLARDQDPEDLAEQVELQNRANLIVRNLHKSTRCPDKLAAKHGVSVATSSGRLLRRLLWLPLDFEEDGSSQRIQAIQLCRSVLRSGSDQQALGLWERLGKIASRLRRSGGSIDLPRLLGEIRPEFEFRDFPDYEADWERITDDTRSALNRVRSSIGRTVSLPRSEDQAAVATRLSERGTAILLGASGTGKSAIAKGQALSAMERGKVIWLDAERLGTRTLAEWRSRLGLGHPLGEVIRAAPSSEALLVFDGLDRLYEDVGFATAAEFVEAAGIGDTASPWRLLITCTPEEWKRVRDMLLSRGLRLPDAPISIDVPDAAELKPVWEAFPALAALRPRRHLAPVLFRPKVLDLLATHGTAEDDLSVIGESDLARLFWSREVARGQNALARAAAAVRLAQSFADRLQPDLSESALVSDAGAVDLSAVGELARDHVLVRAEGRIGFDHDLYGDWVRVRRLLDVAESGQLAEFLASRLSSPIWHRALRLYGVDLMEQADSLAPWARAFEVAGTMEKTAGALAQDILLEASVFASGKGIGLYHPDLWHLLARDDGKLLGRLLNRLFHTATITNSAVVEAVAQQLPDLAIHAAASSRLPYGPFWFRILNFLHAHRDEIPASVHGLAARAADLWLRSTLPKWPLRGEAASIAVALGDALLKSKEENDNLLRDLEPDQYVYRAVLAAGHEEPERVTQIVLEAAGRRAKRFAPPPPPSRSPTGGRKRRVVPVFPSTVDDGPLPDPWPHGPAFRVDGSLQKVVLESDGLQPLTESLPDIAREVLLALLISEPTPRSSSRDRLSGPYELKSMYRWHPHFYTWGPFREFLATAEESAVTAILQLIDHATDRWAEARALHFANDEQRAPDEIPTPKLTIEIDGEMRQFVGDSRVLNWSVQRPNHGEAISSALVALEKHLYDRSDAGEDLAPLIRRLVDESRSVAIIGVLTMVALRHPQYLRGPLRGLLGSPHLISWTISRSSDTAWKYSATSLPRMHHDAYRAWHEMPHRRTTLRDWATHLFLYDPNFRPFLENLRDRFIVDLQAGGEFEGWDLVEGLVAKLDLNNYSLEKGGDGNSYILYTPPEELQRKHALIMEPWKAEMLLMMLPMRCRELLDAESAPESSTLDELWMQAEQVTAMGPDAGNELAAPADGLAGVAAVITLRGGEWRAVYPDRTHWARDIILQTISKSGGGYPDGSAADDDCYAFAAAALHAIWAESPGAPEVRKAVARLALHGPAKHVGTLARGVAQLRSQWPEDHKRLLRAVLLRAGLDARLQAAKQRVSWLREEDERTRWENEIASLQELLAEVERDLAEGRLEASVPGLNDVAPLRSLPEPRPSRSRGRLIADRTINDNLVVAAFKGVPDPDGVDRSDWLDIWERAVLETLSPLRQPDDEPSEEPERHLDKWDRYLMERTAAVVASLTDVDSGRRLWQPIIELGASAEDWVSWFARDWTRYALFPGAEAHVISSWMAMIDEALASPRWEGAGGVTYLSHETGKLWRALLGFTRATADVWSADLRPWVRELESRFAAWAEEHLYNVDNVRIFAHVLALPAAADIVLPGLVWLHDAAVRASDRFWGRAGQEGYAHDTVLNLLAHVWEYARDSLRQHEAAFTAFRGLLESLVSRQYPPALELADLVGTGR